MNTSTETTKNDDLLQESAVHPIDFSDAMDWAEGFVNACTNMDVLSLLPEAAYALYHSTGDYLFQSTESSVNARLACCLCLDALASSPDVLAEVARRLRKNLIETDPRLQVLYGDSHE